MNILNHLQHAEAYRFKYKKETNEDQCMVFFDLEGTLAECERSEDPKDQLDEDLKKYLTKKGARITADKINYYVLPGAIELIRFLYLNECHYSVNFFSNKPYQTTLEFAYQLLENSVGFHRAKCFTGRILSISSCRRITSKYAEEQALKFGFPDCGLLKKPTLFYTSHEENVVLVDDIYSHADLDEEYGILGVNRIVTSKFYCEESVKFYGGDGRVPRECVLKPISRAKKFEDREVWEFSGKKLKILVSENKYLVQFFNLKTDQYERKEIIREQWIDLSDGLDAIWSTCNSDEVKINEKELVNKIYEFVSHHDGDTRCIYTNLNTIIFVAGFLIAAYATSQYQRKSVRDVLKDMQFRPKAEGSEKMELIYQFHREGFYRYALPWLRTEYGSYQLELETPLSFMQAIEES